MKINLSSLTRRYFRRIPLLLILLCGLLGQVQSVWAVACSTSAFYPPQNMTVTINVSAYAGNDMPIGSTIYRNQNNVSGTLGVHCDGAFSLPAYLSVSNAPSGPSFNFSGMAYGSGQIYPTNVSGVGVAVWHSGTTFSSSTPYLFNTFSMPGGGDVGGSMQFDISLIKTGPIASGSQVNSSSFPTVVYTVPAASGYTGLPVTLLTVNFAGSVNFITSTCTTPDYTVQMGTYSINQTFKAVGSTTPWVDASIQLKNCPTFSGYYADGSTNQISVGTATAGGNNKRKSNLMSVSLAPTTSLIDATNGVIGLSNFGTTGTAATGVGLQLGYTAANINASPTSPATIWNLGAAWSVTPPNNGTANFSIPLAARYYQSSSTPTAGPANAQVVFTINYM